MMASSIRLTIAHIFKDFSIDQLDDSVWIGTSQVLVSRYWSGNAATEGREFSARLLWSDTALYVRFRASRSDPLIVSEKPEVTKKAVGLWNRDVCEIFIAPDRSRRNKYFEFEVAPTGEWVDLAINAVSRERQTDLNYRSGMTSAAQIEKDEIVMAIKIPWEAFGRRPIVGDIWLGNLYRCVGKGKTRGYLAWQPTMTETPNFHVPEKFGEFHFVSQTAA